jgi:hypothetical protein
MCENIYIQKVSLTSSKTALIKTKLKLDEEVEGEKIIEIFCIVDNKSTYVGSASLDIFDVNYEQILKVLMFKDLCDIKFKLDEDRLTFAIFNEEQCPIDSQSMIQHILLTISVIKASSDDLNSLLSESFREQSEMGNLQEQLKNKDQEISIIFKQLNILKRQNDEYLKSILPNCMALVNSKKARIVELEKQLEKFTKPNFGKFHSSPSLQVKQVKQSPKKSTQLTPKRTHKVDSSDWISPRRKNLENLSRSPSIESSPKKRTPIKGFIDFGFKKLREESSSDEEIGESSKSIKNINLKSPKTSDNFLKGMKPIKVMQHSSNDENSPEVMNDMKRARSQDNEIIIDCKRRRTNEFESTSSTTKSGEYGTPPDTTQKPPAADVSSEEIFAQRLTPDVDDEIIESSQPSNDEVENSPNIFSTPRIRSLRSQKSQQPTNDKNKSVFSIDTEEF